MSLVIRCKDATNTTIVLGSVRLGTAGFATAAEQGTMAQGTTDIPDKGGVLRLAGLKEIWATEDDSPADNRIFWIGYLADRHIHRGDGELLTGSDRVITANVYDLNELLNDIIIKGAGDATHGVRPAETDLQRVAWVLQATPSWFPTAGGVAAVHDQGFVATTGGVAMDACDYRGQTPQAVLQDCADKSGRNWFIYFDEAAVLFALWYDVPESANWVCTLSFSNVEGDADQDTIWWMNPASPIEVQDPGKIVSGVRAVYSGGEVFRHASDVGLSTATDFYLREQTAPSANTKTAAKAQVMADRMLRDNDEEENSASFEVLLPSTKVGLVRAGMRTSCRFEHFDPPYRDWTDWRILRLETRQDEPNPDWYNVKLEVTPLPPLPGCSYVAPIANPPSPGSTDIFGSHRGSDGTFLPAGTVYPSTWEQVIYPYPGDTPFSPYPGEHPNDGSMWGIPLAILALAPGEMGARWIWDLDSLGTPAICTAQLAIVGLTAPSVEYEIKVSDDGTTWTSVTPGGMPWPNVVPFSPSLTHRYWCVEWIHDVPSGNLGGSFIAGYFMLWAST